MRLMPSTTFGRLLLILAALLFALGMLMLMVVRAFGLGPSTETFSNLIAGNVELAANVEVLPQQTASGLGLQRAVAPPANAGGPVMPFQRHVTEHLRRYFGPDTRVLFAGAPESRIWVSTPQNQNRWVSVRIPPLVEQAIGTTLMLSLFGLLVSVVMAYWFAHSLAHPLQRLAALAPALSRGESPDSSPSLGGPTEVITLEKALRAAGADVRQSARDREMLLAGVSHDLCTPLARLRLALELQPGIPTAERELLQSDIDEMNAIISQFLDYVRDGRDESAQSVDLVPMIDDLIDDSAEAGFIWQRRGLASLPCDCRPLSLRRALRNMIHNAELHGAAPFAIEVSDENGEVRIVVSDSGPGVPEKWLPKAGLPFSRANSARSGKPGAGLGLSLVSRVAQAHGGRLNLRNLPGKGFEARLSWPGSWTLKVLPAIDSDSAAA